MKSRFGFMGILITLLLLISQISLAALNISNLWTSGAVWGVPGKTGPSLIAKNSGNILYLSRDGALYELAYSGGIVQKGQGSGITNIVAPPAYIEGSSNNYIIYVTAQGTGNNKLVVHRFTNSNSGGTAVSTTIDNSSYGVVAYKDGSGNLIIYFGTMAGTLYRVVYDTTSNTFSTPNTANLNDSIKAPPVLNVAKTQLYVITQNGKFYKMNASNLSNLASNTFGGEFTTPMAVDENGFVYVLSNDGTLFKIDPSDLSEKHARYLSSANSSGPLIDGDGIIYIFGDNGKIVALNDQLTKYGEYTIGQNISTTPAIVKGTDGTTYLIVPSSNTAGTGTITILSFNSTTGQFTKVWEYNTPSVFVLSSAVTIAPLGALSENYYFVTATNDGKIYGWQFNARGPFGIWAKYGQNINNTGFIDQSAVAFQSRIYIIAKEGYNGRELSSSLLGSTTSYGILYDATVLNADNTIAIGKKQYHTNETDLSKIPAGNPGQKLEVKFASPTTVRMFLNRYITPKGASVPATDAEFKFRFWEAADISSSEGNESSNPATLTFRYSDRTINIYADATYTYYIYHSYPSTSTSTKLEGFFNYGAYRNNLNAAVITIPSVPNYSGKTYYAYKWNIYEWDPTSSTGYKRTTLYDQDSVKLKLSGPAYIEIYYAELNATITMLLPEFAYGKTRAYIFLDAATNSIAETIEATMLKGITISDIISKEYADGVREISSLSSLSSDRKVLKIALQSFENPLPSVTRVATIALNLLVPDRLAFTGQDSNYFMQYFDIYGYAQAQGQQVDPTKLVAKKSFKTNRFLYVVGDFNNDFVVDINDWNLFSQKLGTTVSGTEIIYNIGSRQDFNPPYPNYMDYRAGFLTDTTNVVDAQDFYYFASMFGFVVQESDRVKTN